MRCRAHQSAIALGDSNRSIVLHVYTTLSQARAMGTGKCTYRSQGSSTPSTTPTVTCFDSAPSVVVTVAVPPASATTPIAHQAQLAHHAPVGAVTQKLVGAAEKGCAAQISDVPG